MFSLFTIANNSDNVVPNQLTAHRSSVWKLIFSYEQWALSFTKLQLKCKLCKQYTLNYAR